MLEYVTPRELAEEFGISINSVEQRCRRGKIPGVVQLGGRWMIPREAASNFQIYRSRTPIAWRGEELKEELARQSASAQGRDAAPAKKRGRPKKSREETALPAENMQGRDGKKRGRPKKAQGRDELKNLIEEIKSEANKK